MALPDNIKLTLELDGIDNASQPIEDVNASLGEYKDKATEAGKASTEAANTSKVSWTEFRSAYSTVLEVGRVGLEIWKETVDATVELSNSVRSMRDVTGQSAEESSRLIQVLDDYKVTVADAEKATKKLAGEGLQFNIETLAKLSDQYLALNNDVDRTNFLYEKFGKSGDRFAEIMKQGSTAILEANDAISKNLVLTDKQLQNARDYEKNLDNLNDTVLAYKVTLGNQLIPVMNDVITVENRVNELMEQGLNPYEARRQAAQELADANRIAALSVQELDKGERDNIVTMQDATLSAEDLAEAQQKISDSNKEFLSTLGSVQSEFDSYSEKYQKINEDMSLSDDERKAKLEELTAEHEQSNRRIILSLLERKLTQDGILDDKELQWLLAKGEAWGIYSETVVQETQKAINEANALADAINGIPESRDINLNVHTNYSSAGQAQLTQQIAGEKNYTPHASGGSFVIPSSYGNEGFRLGNKDTASGGERLTITPANKDPNADIIAALYATRLDETKVARMVLEGMLQGSR